MSRASWYKQWKTREVVRDRPRHYPAATIEGDDDVRVHVAVVRRETDRAFQLVLSRGFWNHEVLIWVPKSVMDGQDIEAGQRNRLVRIPKWLWERIVTEVKDRNY